MALAKSMNTSECYAYYRVNIGDIIRLKTKDLIMNKDEYSIENIELEDNYTVADYDFLNESGINNSDVQQNTNKTDIICMA